MKQLTCFKLFTIATCILTFLFIHGSKAQSLYMPAATNWVSVGDLDVPGDQLTVEALIYYTGASVDIVSKHTDPSNVNYLLRIGSFEITTTSGFAAFSGAAAAGVTIQPNKMYHVAATYDGTMLKYYVNGCLTGQMPWTGMMIQSNLVTAIGNMSTCQCEQFLGYIDEVRIWNVARTQTEITTNMLNLPSPTTQPGLLAYYKFDGSYVNLQGNTAFDGVPVGAPIFQQAPLPYPTTIHQNLTSSNPVCSGEANGLINVTASGYYTPYEYSLDGITYGTSSVIQNLTAGTYTVFTRPQNNNNCATSSSITLTDPAVLSPNLVTTNVSCNGGNNGTATVAPSGGDGAPYSVTWQPSLSSSTTLTGLAAGSYSVDIDDSCRAAGPELVVNGHFEDGLTGFTTGYICCAGGPGNFAVDADPNFYNGGHFGSGYGGGGNYLIVDGSTTPGTSVWCQSIPVSPNTYYTLSAFISSNYPIELAIADFTINGVSVGTVTAPATTFTWDPFLTVWYSGASTSANICISDQNIIGGGNDFGIDNISFKTCLSCSINTPFSITEPLPLTVSSIQTNVSCAGGNNGSATASAAGGTGTYSYSWSTVPAQLTATASNLSAGTYTVTVTDQNLCTATDVITITEPTALSASISAQINVSCNGGTNGAATGSGNGGVGPYSSSWNTVPAQNTFTATNLAAGSYTVTISDQNSCTATATVTITEPPALSVGIAAQTDVDCNGAATGSATASAAGGSPAYNYSWNTAPVQNSSIANGLTAGTYIVTVTDQNSCSSTNTVTILEPSAISFVLDTAWGPSCNGDTNGAIFSTGTGGTLPYNFTWTPAISTADSALNLTAGNYNITLTDGNGCSQSVSATLTEPLALTLGVTASQASFCLGDSTVLAGTANGGTLPYSYSWSNGSVLASQTVQPASSGTFSLTVNDANNCSILDSAVITVLVPQDIDLGNDTAICQGENILLDAGAGFSSYLWQDGSNLQTFNSTVTGLYYVTATDANGCIEKDTLSLIVNPLPLPALADTAKICPGTSTTLSATTGFLNYSWNTGQATASINVSAAGNYVLFVTDLNGCSNSDSTFVVLHPLPTLLFSATPLSGCPPLIVTTTNNSLLNGTTTTFNWTIGSNSYSQFAPVTELTTGFHDLYLQGVTNNGCTVDTLVTSYIEVFPEPMALPVPQPAVYELYDSEINISNQSQGANAYIWSLFGNFVTFDTDLVYPVTDTGSYTFSLIAINQDGCRDTADATIIVNPSFALYFPTAFTPNSNGNNDEYMPKGYGIHEYELLIFDRWGEQVFKSTDLYEGWDGSYLGGAPVSAVYVYKCTIRDIQGNKHFYMGHVTLVH
jgi:gliding motility-associated-like protein